MRSGKCRIRFVRCLKSRRQRVRHGKSTNTEALRAQVNPHFLFNTLNAIRWMAIIRKADNIVACIDALATMLKYSMSRGGELVTLKDELDNINSYIYIYNCRYGNQFTLETDLDRELLELQVVKFILQPIVENAVIHGFKGSEKQGTIMIYGDVENGVLKLYVEDNGCGLQNGEAEAQSGRKVTGIGIANVDARIKSAYGAQYGLLVYNGAGLRNGCGIYAARSAAEGGNRCGKYWSWMMNFWFAWASNHF